MRFINTFIIIILSLQKMPGPVYKLDVRLAITFVVDTVIISVFPYYYYHGYCQCHADVDDADDADADDADADDAGIFPRVCQSRCG